MTQLYDVIRYHKKNKKKLIHYKITLEQAREWCGDDLTKGKDYFDGFATSGTYCVDQNPKYTHYFTPNKEYN